MQQNSNNYLNILTVEDNPGDLFLVQDMLRSLPLRIDNLYSADRVFKATEILENHNIQLVLLDLSLPDSFGLESFMGIQQAADHIPVIILTGLSDTSIALEAIKSGAQDYLVKGEFNESMLTKSIQYSLERKHNMESLWESNERFNMVVKATNDVIWDRNLLTNEIFWVGNTFQKLFGYDYVDMISPAELWEQSLHPADKKRVLSKLSTIIIEAKSQSWEDQYRFKKSDGTYAYVHDRGYIIFEQDKLPVRMIGSTQDITERKRSEQVIIASEEKYRQMFYKNPYPAWIYDYNTLTILEVNDAAINNYGYSRDEFLNLTLKAIYQPEDLKMLVNSINKPDFNHVEKMRLWRQRKKNGDPVIAEVAHYPIEYFGKVAIQEQINDVTEKRNLEKKLARQQKIKRQQITDAVLGAQEKERTHIGRELHDNINQILATSKLFLDVILEENLNDFALIEKSKNNISLAIEEIRKISKSLITPVMDDLELGQSVKDLTRNMLELKKMKILLDVDEIDEDNLSGDQKLTVYRILQEHFNNIVKYAEATEVSVRIITEDDKINVSVSDNGKGFDLKAVRRGVGITNMTSRAELFNGKVEIDSTPGNGCILHVSLNSKTPVTELTL